MYYCNECGRKKGWPTDCFLRSVGPCECCGKKAVCNDVKSGDLPKPISNSNTDSYRPARK